VLQFKAIRPFAGSNKVPVRFPHHPADASALANMGRYSGPDRPLRYSL